MSTEYIERGDAFSAISASVSAGDAIDRISSIPAADVEPVVQRTTFDDEGALAINNFIDLCEVDSEAMDGFVQDRFKTYLRALVYESVPAHMEMSGERPDGICTGCKKLNTEICGSCMRNGHGNDVDFYDSGRGAE